MSINLHVTINIGLASYVATFILNLTIVCLLGYLLLLVNMKYEMFQDETTFTK